MDKSIRYKALVAFSLLVSMNCHLLLGQDNSNKMNLVISSGANYSSIWHYYEIGLNEEIASNVKDKEHGAFGYSFKLQENFNFSQNFHLRAGLSFSQMSYEVDEFDFFDINGVFIRAISYRNSSQFVNLPLNLSFDFSTNLYVLASITPNLNIENKRTIFSRYSDGKITSKTEDTNRLNDWRKFNSSVGVGMGYRFLKFNGNHFFVECDYSVNAFKAYNSASINRRLGLLSLNIGLNFHAKTTSSSEE